MLKEKELKENEFRAHRFSANKIPRTTTEPLFKKIMTE